MEDALKIALTIVKPLVETLLIGIVPLVVTVLSGKIMGTLKITDEAKRVEIERLLRDALHASADNAVRFARSKLAGAGMTMTTAAVVREAVEYVRDKNPDALSKLGVDDDKLTDIIRTKIAS